MLYKFSLIFFTALFIWGCTSEPKIPDGQIPFDRDQWADKTGPTYVYRDQMTDAVLYSDTLRSLMRDELLKQLGEPDREEKGHLYYTVVENRLGFWTLNQKSIVIKLKPDQSVEWIKMHE